MWVYVPVCGDMCVEMDVGVDVPVCVDECVCLCVEMSECGCMYIYVCMHAYVGPGVTNSSDVLSCRMLLQWASRHLQ